MLANLKQILNGWHAERIQAKIRHLDAELKTLNSQQTTMLNLHRMWELQRKRQVLLNKLSAIYGDSK